MESTEIELKRRAFIPCRSIRICEVPTAGDEFEVYPDEKTMEGIGDRATDARATKLAQQMASRKLVCHPYQHKPAMENWKVNLI